MDHQRQLRDAINANSVDRVSSLITCNDLYVINGKFMGYGTPLICASASGYINIVKVLIEAGLPYEARRAKCGADVNYVNNYGNTALMRAIKQAHIDVVNLLIERGAIVRNDDLKVAKS